MCSIYVHNNNTFTEQTIVLLQLLPTYILLYAQNIRTYKQTYCFRIYINKTNRGGVTLIIRYYLIYLPSSCFSRMRLHCNRVVNYLKTGNRNCKVPGRGLLLERERKKHIFKENHLDQGPLSENW